MVRKGILFVGLVLAVVATLGFFLFSQSLMPTQARVLVSNIDISAGTDLIELPAGSFTEVTVGADETFLDLLVTPERYERLLASGGVFITDVASGEPLRLVTIASADNPAAVNFAALANTDPNMVIYRIEVENTVPDGVRAGDRLDIAVAVTNLRYDNETGSVLATEKMEFEAVEELKEEDPAAVPGTVEETVASGEIPAEVPMMLPNARDTAEFLFQPPVSKIVVWNARVVRVVRATQAAPAGPDGEEQPTVQGDITAIDVLIPRAALEWVTMSNSAGLLRLALVSPLAGSDTPPSIGASLQDMLNLFYADRGLVMPESGLQPVVPEP